MAECEHRARTTAYYDGGLAPEAEAEAVAHLAGCADCQSVLGDAVGIDAALADVPIARSRRRTMFATLVGIVAIAAALAVWFGTRGRTPAKPEAVAFALELPRERALEVRFSGARFSPHRALGTLRGDRAREPIALQSIAELEKRGEHADLVAALAASGDLARAEEVAARLPASAANESDRAAIALAAGQPERALAHAYHAVDRDPMLASARWNLALATRELGLVHVAHAAFERIATVGERGWSDEARLHAAALARDLAGDAALVAIEARGKAMVTGGAPLTADDVARAPGPARIHFLDAVRLAGDRARLDALRPLATALDTASGTRTAMATIDRVDLATTAKFSAGYRALVTMTAQPDEVAQLLAKLRVAGPKARDHHAGALIFSGRATAAWRELRSITSAWQDPWFDLAVERERIRATWPGTDLRAEAPLVAALAGCPASAGQRCGQLALDLATLLSASGRDELAEQRAIQAVDHLRRAGAVALAVRARAFVAELHRRGGRTARARAEFDELVLAPGSDCEVKRYAQIGHAALAIVDGDWQLARESLPPAEPPEGCRPIPDVQGLAVAVDLARASGQPSDAGVARRWIAATREPAGGGFAIVAEARIARGPGVAEREAAREWIRGAARDRDPMIEAARTWGISTLLADAGAREDWADALAIAAWDQPVAATAPCVVVASLDDEQLTIAARVAGKTLGSHRRIARATLASEQIVPDEIVAELAGCIEVPVIARPPLHGRADLLPAATPWWFAGDASGSVRATTAPSLEVVDARPPTLPRLVALPSTTKFTRTLAAAEATPSRVLSAIADAGYVELHVHGVAAAHDHDATYLALSPDADGKFALRADAVRAAKLKHAPLVVLAACRAAVVAPYLRARWSLPDAFVAAGASAVIAVDVPISDASARRVFDDIHRRVDAGEPVAAAVAAVRAKAGPDVAWARRLMVFR